MVDAEITKIDCCCGQNGTYTSWDILFPGVADPRNLMPMYEKLHSTIRKIDDEHIIFFEPTIIVTSVSQHSPFTKLSQ